MSQDEYDFLTTWASFADLDEPPELQPTRNAIELIRALTETIRFGASEREKELGEQIFRLVQEYRLEELGELDG